jgi:catechol 2,3-dioxygenase-like lactoylglutathione lyase family enzyme
VSVVGIDHVAITVSNVESTLIWYESVLGAESLYVDLWRAGTIPVVILQVGASRLSIHDAAAPGTPGASAPTVGSVDLCFRWKGSIAAAIVKIESLGITIEEGPVDRPASNGVFGQSIYIRDPDANLIELLSVD